MKHPHNHEEWKQRKDERRSQTRSRPRDKREAGDHYGPAPGNDSDKQGKSSKMKLALNQRMATALVTQHHLSQNEADDLFNECYKDAEASLN